MPPTPVQWDGFINARDLGGLPTVDGRVTHPGRMVRSGDLRFVTERGWHEAHAAGIRTVVDLRNDDEVLQPVVSRPRGIDVVRIPLDDVDDTEMWGEFRAELIDGTPLYYRPFMARKPQRCAAAVRAVADARPGGVLFHCGAGRDRTGLVALLVLALAGVGHEDIAADYARSAVELPALFALWGAPDQGPVIESVLADKGTTTRQALLDVLDGFDAASYLRDAGLSSEEMRSVRARLVDQ